MFARLREHANAIEADLQNLDRSLQNKTKAIYSISRQEDASEESKRYIQELIEELQRIEKESSDTAKELVKSNADHGRLQKDLHAAIKSMGDSASKMEDHLQEFGYVKMAEIDEIGDQENGNGDMLDHIHCNNSLAF